MSDCPFFSMGCTGEDSLNFYLMLGMASALLVAVHLRGASSCTHVCQHACHAVPQRTALVVICCRSGMFQWKNSFLAHERLAIIDPASGVASSGLMLPTLQQP
eukprot:GHUV01013385.1.p2 GENE.GHUV01013385.1~~GHUV01013385.1.p2  ORF type:complete len:103 (+),score=27.06 GHUV01013385.1:983-1291(+)